MVMRRSPGSSSVGGGSDMTAERGIPDSESIRVEFKSDVHRVPDQDLFLTAVCLANNEGGTPREISLSYRSEP